MLKKLLAVALLSQIISSVAFAADPVPVASCDDAAKRSMGSPCMAYIGRNFRDQKTLGRLKQACDNGKSQWLVRTACPAQGRMGICKMNVAQDSETWAVYYGQERAAAEACTSALGGTWSAR